MNAPADDAPFDEFTGPGAGVAATLYDPDGAGHPRAITLIYNNIRFVPMVGARGNITTALVPSTVTVAPGQVIQVGSVWHLVAKVLGVGDPFLFNPGTSLALLAMPYQVTITRASTGQRAASRNPWLELAGATAATTSGHIPGTPQTHTVRAGYSNANDPTDETIVGPAQNGLYTLYAPPHSDVLRGDQATVPDGRPAQVDNAQPLYADGSAFALQLILRLTGGSGLT